MAEVKDAPRSKTEVAKGQGHMTEVERRSSSAGEGNPLSMMYRLADEMDRVFEDLGLTMPNVLGRGREMLRRESGLIPSGWSPRVTIRESEGQFLVSADLPGLSKDDINVELLENMLVIQGERKQEKKEERKGFSYSECSFGSFYRAIPLPEGVDSSKASAEFRNGVLEISMPAPRRAETHTRRLEIQEKK
ncbi:Hsp20/alpha crystallin family protein [Tundrisphaera lichenicola]|uniref:Hsp20/alpha crystallin family protein n=1 Tax=Tundrisphaera lichenicola TaxID=2029860 RepID=UPI003EBE5AAF